MSVQQAEEGATYRTHGGRVLDVERAGADFVRYWVRVETPGQSFGGKVPRVETAPRWLFESIVKERVD